MARAKEVIQSVSRGHVHPRLLAAASPRYLLVMLSGQRQFFSRWLSRLALQLLRIRDHRSQTFLAQRSDCTCSMGRDMLQHWQLTLLDSLQVWNSCSPLQL